MLSLSGLLQNFFMHKDFLPPAEQVPGTLFTPMHILFAVLLALATGLLCLHFRKKSEKTIQKAFAGIWAVVTLLEVAKILWETCSGATVNFDWAGIMSLYPCSIFMYAMPFAIWGKGTVRRAACGYVCTLGLLGGAINFVYPANVLSSYSCLSFAGLHTLLYHGAIVFCAVTMLLSGYHRFTGIRKWKELFLPAVPFLVVSVAANVVNFSSVDSDYMFFKLESFFFAPLGAATADWLSVLIVYGVYLLIHALPYLPAWIAHRHKAVLSRNGKAGTAV